MTEEIGTAVADVRDGQNAVANKGADTGGAHTALLDAIGTTGENLLVGGPKGLKQEARQLLMGSYLQKLMEGLRHRVRGDSGSHIAPTHSTHPIGNEKNAI